ncbi:MAG: hypothetical protein H6622_04600 [Halobacteriovoraceae bacterium]|nr:hypothetical protein [Halobacteriovoraceae bacterium]
MFSKSKYLFSTIILFYWSLACAIDGKDFSSECERILRGSYPQSPEIRIAPIEYFYSPIVGFFYIGKAYINTGTESIRGHNMPIIFIAQERQESIHPAESLKLYFYPLLETFSVDTKRIAKKYYGIDAVKINWYNPLKDSKFMAMSWFVLTDYEAQDLVYMKLLEMMKNELDVLPDIFHEIEDKELATSIIELGISSVQEFGALTSPELWSFIENSYPLREHLTSIRKIYEVLTDHNVKLLWGRIEHKKDPKK